jgi:hypothetical protein
MAILPDIKPNRLTDDPQEQINSITRQMNEWGRIISNESRTKIINDDSGTPRILIGYQQDGF